MQRSNSLLLLLLLLVALTAACGNEFLGRSPGELSDAVRVSISAGRASAAMVNQAGGLRVWGDNQYHQLGGLSDDTQDIPITVDPPDTQTIWRSVSAGGYHMIAIARHDTERTLWGWGANECGQAGDDEISGDVIRPHQIGSDTDWKFISAGLSHSTAIKNDGTLWSWGQNVYGQLGYSGVSVVTSPTRVGTEAGWSFVSAGHRHTLALRNTDLYAWGSNTWGQCGNGEHGNNLFEPEYIGSGWEHVSAGYTVSAGVKVDGTLWAWGGYNAGAVYLGDGTTVGSRTPIQVGTDEDWQMVSVGGNGNFTIALKQDGSLWAWGSCIEGHLGNGTFSGEELSPVEIQQGTAWACVAAGDRFSLGLRQGGSPYSWGDNGYGQLGVGGNDDSNVPVPVQLP